MKKVNYIETTLNGYVVKRVEICDYKLRADYFDKLIFDLDGEKVNFYEDIAGDLDSLDSFLRNGSTECIEDYDNAMGEAKNVYLEGWRTLILGYHTDKFVGLEIKEKSIH